MEYIILAAGGNATAIVLIDALCDRTWYEEQGRELMQCTEHLGVEQAGFLHLDSRHFEMSGGEFCGNAARSAAMLIAKHANVAEFDFTMSGYEGSVHAKVVLEDSKAFVTCTFPNLQATAQPVVFQDGGEGEVVDLGGIVHVLVKEPFLNDRSVYEAKHRKITEELRLTERSAVGLCWLVFTDSGVVLHPVVWVRGIDSFFYETACGSGSIAAGVATGMTEIIQPSGQSISVVVDNTGIHLSSSMEILDA